jgi:outer membrane protein
MSMKSLSLFVLTFALTAVASAADLKIGVVDVAKAFSEYYKTKDANAQLQENAAKAKEELNERLATYKKLNEEAENKGKVAQDPVLSDSARAKARAEFQNKVNELRVLDRDLQEFRQRRSDQLQQENLQQRKGLYDEILKVIVDKAKADGYDLVFDKSGVGASLMPILLHAKEGATTDFTPELIIELNKNAPAPSATPEARPAESETKSESKASEPKSGSKGTSKKK